jgi:hypothetical protein
LCGAAVPEVVRTHAIDLPRGQAHAAQGRATYLAAQGALVSSRLHDVGQGQEVHRRSAGDRISQGSGPSARRENRSRRRPRAAATMGGSHPNPFTSTGRVAATQNSTRTCGAMANVVPRSDSFLIAARTTGCSGADRPTNRNRMLVSRRTELTGRACRGRRHQAEPAATRATMLPTL